MSENLVLNGVLHIFSMAAVSQQRQRIDDRQKAVLIDYMTEHSYFAKHGIGPGPQGKELGDRMWSTLATRLNACGKAQKNVSGWKQVSIF